MHNVIEWTANEKAALRCHLGLINEWLNLSTESFKIKMVSYMSLITQLIIYFYHLSH